MKKFIVATLVALSSVAFAGSGSKVGSQEITNRVPFSASDRVLIFGSLRNAVSSTGQLLVCNYPNRVSYSSNDCFEPKLDKNAWQLAETALPGYVLTSYEFRFVGAGGNQVLILYFGVK